MSIEDVIKNSFLENFTNTFAMGGIVTMTLALLAAMGVGLYICFVYNRFYRGVVYSRTFAMTLVGMTVMTAAVTLAISTNVVISLGMVGALSIVRFRTAVKEPLDLLYLFWAITTGICAGAQMYALCGITAVLMTVLAALFSLHSNRGHVYIVIVHYQDELTEDSIRMAMGNFKHRVKSRTVRSGFGELAIEVFVRNENMVFVDKLNAIQGVQDVTLIQYDGEYHG